VPVGHLLFPDYPVGARDHTSGDAVPHTAASRGCNGTLRKSEVHTILLTQGHNPTHA